MFVDFNKRYDSLNGELAILKDPKIETPLAIREKLTLVDYFNLCAEEYLFHRRGYIHPEAWRAWTNGMRDIFCSPRILAFWMEEAGTDSYYSLQRLVSLLVPDAEGHGVGQRT